MNKKDQILNYSPSEDFIHAFNEDAQGFSHTFKYDSEKDKIFFSALTHNCGCIQMYVDSTDEMEENFINQVNSEI